MTDRQRDRQTDASDVVICPMQIINYYAVPVMELTANVDLQLTEVCKAINDARKLHDEVSVRRQAEGTL